MEKKQKRGNLILRQQEIVKAAKSEGRELSDEEKREFDTAQSEIENLTREIENEGVTGETGNKDNDNFTGSRGITEERNRIIEISDMCREFEMDPEKTREHIKNGDSVETVRAAVLNRVRENKAPIGSRATLVGDSEDKRRSAMTDALLMRSGTNLDNPAPGSREFMGMTLRDIAIDCLSREGENNAFTRSTDELFTLLQRGFYNPTAAFPAILDNAINKAYVEGHRTAPVTFDKWTKRGSLKDFKTYDNNYLAGPVGEFLEVPEGGELKHDVFGDEKKPTRKLKTYGRQFTLTRQAFINDDIDLVTRIPAKYAASARKTQNKQVYQILTNNPAVYDGTALFSSKHMNLLSKGTGITKEAVQGMIMALQNQVDEFGEAIIIRPATIIVPSGYAFDMYTLFFSPTINTEGNTQSVNPLYQYRDSIQVIEDPTINVLCGGFGNVMPWWLLGSNADTDFIEVDYLNGQEVPTIRRMETPGQIGFVWDIFLDWGISVMDFRGGIKNPGIEIKNPIELA